MIRGVFNDREARVPLVVRGKNAKELGVAAILDTGFSGFLTLPPTVIAELELVWISRVEGLVGDGTHQVFDLYEGVVIWDDDPCEVEIAVSQTEPLLGMGMIYGHDLRIQAIEDGLVTIEAMRPS